MHLRRTFFLASLAFAIPLANAAAQPAPAPTSSASAAADTDPMSDKALELFNEGKKLFRERKYGQAEAAFEAAWAIALKSKGIAANLGECEMNLGKYREAAEHLTISLRLAPPTDPQRTRTDANLTAVKKKIGTLVITANVAGAEVFVNGQKVGDAPLLDPIYVDPGKVKVRVRAEDHTSWEKELDVIAGQEEALSATLTKPTPVPTATASVTATVPPPPPPRSKVPAFVLGGAAVVGAALGTGLLVGSRDQYEATRKLTDEIRAAGGTCKAGAPGFDVRCADAEGAANTSNALKVGGIVAFAVAGAAAAGAITYLLWPTPKPAQGSVRVVPVAAADTSGVVISGRF